MRRTLVTSRGFHAPRSSGGAPPPPPPPPPTSSSSTPTPAAAAATAAALPITPSVTTRGSPKASNTSSTRQRTSTKAASSSPSSTSKATSTRRSRRPSTSTPAPPPSAAPPSNGNTVHAMLAGRAPLSGHFGANHLRRGVRREETHEDGDGVAAKTSSGSTASTAAASARIHVAPTTAEVTASAAAAAAAAATAESEGESRKRLRSSSMESTLSASADGAPQHTALVEDYYASFAPRPTRRLSACVQRNVFYPPPAELAVAESGPEAEVPSTRVAPSPGVVPERDVWAGAMSMAEEEPLELPPHLPTSAPHSSLPSPEKQREVLFPDGLMTCGGGGNGEEALSSSSASTTPSGTRFLSALEHQQLFSAPPTFTPALVNTSPHSTASQPPRPPKALTFSQDSSAAMDCPLLLNSPAATPPPSPRSPTAATAAAAAAEAAKEECVRQTEENVSRNTGHDAPAVNTNAAAETNKASVLNNAGPFPIISATAAEEEHVESDEALQREIAEDLRLSMDVAFTPSGSGNGAPPVLSQSSFLHDEEEEREEQRSACTKPAVAEAVGGVHAVTSQHSSSAVTGNRDLSAPAMECGGSSVTADTCLPFSSPSWPLHEAPPPHLPMPFAGETCTRLPLAVVAASAAVSAAATGSRHRTVFSFSSRKVVDAVAVAAVAAEAPEEGGVASFSSAPAPPAESPQPAAVLSTTVPEAEGEGTILLPPAFLPPQLLIGEAQPPLPPPSTAAAPPPEKESSSVRRDVAATVGADESGERSCPLPPSSPLRDAPLADILPPSLSSRSECRPPLSVSPQRSAGGEGDAVSPRHLFAPVTLSASTAAAPTARRGRTCFTLHSGLPTTGPSATVSAAREEGSNSSNSMSVPLPPAVTEETSVSVGPVLPPQLPLVASTALSPSLPATSSTHEEPPAVVREAAVHPTAEASLLVADSYAGSEWVGVDAAPATALSPPQTTVLQTEAAKTAVMPQSELMRATAAAAATTTAHSPVPSINIPYALPATAPGVEAQGQQQQPLPLPPELPLSTTTNTFYDLPPSMQEFYAKHRGVRRLYDWQHDLLTQPEVRAGRNFIYSLPTSGGKTLVAELSLLRCVVNRRKSGIFVLPFVSLAEEKTLALQPLTTAFDFAVDGHYGSSGRFPLCDAPAIYVCTIEKANSLLNYMVEEERTCEIGAVVVDELHMLGESRRGATLELFLSKLLMIDSRRQEQRERAAALNASSLHRPASETQTAAPNLAADAEYWPDDEACYFPEEDEMTDAVQPPLTPPYVDPGPLQIIAMSATIPNLSTLARWLRAACFERDFRPVPLHAYSVVGGLVLRDGQTNERNLSGSSVAQHLLELATEVPEASVLIFCASRQQCVDTARGIVQYLKAQAIAGQQLPVIPGSISSSSASAPGFSVFGVPFAELGKGAASVASVPSQASAAIRSLLTDLEALSHHEASQLSEIVPHGVAFHHGGLLAEERELIEDAFRRKHVRILCSTSTLAAGVNLPARRVIIKTPYVGRDFLTKSRYLQMCGRAGRAGLDPYGESYLLLTRRDQSRGHALMRAGVEACQSQILEDDQTLTRSLLECIGVGLVTDSESARRWSASLLSCHAAGPVDAAWRQYLSSSSPSFPGLATAAVCASASPSATTTSPAAAGEAAAVTEESENSRSVPLPISTAALDGVPLPALTAMTRASLSTLARCGLVTTCAASPPDAATENEEGESDKRKAGEEEKSDVDVQVRVTPFGSSSVRSCFSVEEALLLREELDELRHTGLILSDDLHLCYFLTPLREVGECDWEMLRLMMSRMSDSRQRIASLLGVDPYFIDQQAMGLGGPLQVTEEGRRRLFTAKRFYVALMLADVLAEVPMATVEQRYNVNRGQLQNLMRSASMFSSSITSFCHAMEWYSLEAVLSSFVKRLGFGVKPDLLPLMEIRGMQPPRARALWNAGFKKLAAIAAADADDMVAKVKSLNPVDSKSAKFFTKRSALMVIREAHLTLQSQIKEKKGELQELTVRRGVGQ